MQKHCVLAGAGQLVQLGQEQHGRDGAAAGLRADLGQRARGSDAAEHVEARPEALVLLFEVGRDRRPSPTMRVSSASSGVVTRMSVSVFWTDWQAEVTRASGSSAMPMMMSAHTSAPV